MVKGEAKIRSLRPLKFKDKIGRDRLVLDLEYIFKFQPKTIIIEKVHGRSSTMVISAVIPDEILKMEKEAIKKNRKLMESKKKILEKLEKT